MLLYMRCTFEDIQKVFMFLRSKKISVAVGAYSSCIPHSSSTEFIWLSGLTVSNSPCLMLCTDATLSGDSGGYGYIFSDSGDTGDRYLEWDYNCKSD